MAVLQGSAKSVAQDGGFYPTTIDQSLRFNDNDSAYLSRTPSVAGNRKTWTFSAWVKRGNLDSYQTLFSCGDSLNQANPEGGFIAITSANVLYFRERKNPTYHYQLVTNALFRDASAWYHIVVSVDTTQSTSADRVKLYVNGEQIISFSTASYPPQNYDTFINKATVHGIGADTQAGSSWTQSYLDSYLAEVHFTDGTAYTADAFGEFKSGVWVAKTPSVTYGTNGFYLDFADSGNIGNDANGSNNWTPTNLASTDVMLDSPTNNFATLNEVLPNAAGTLSEGNLRSTHTAASWAIQRSTIAPTSGKWYCELCVIDPTTGAEDWEFGIVDITALATALRPTSGQTSLYSSNYSNADRYYLNAVENSIGTPAYSATLGNIIAMAYDIDAGTVDFYVNNVLRVSTTMSDFEPVVQLAIYGGNSGQMNFGQDSSFAGAKTPQGNTDANGIGDFYYAPPTGYLALCTANLPEPAISPANDASPSDYFNTILWSGDNTNNRSITGVGFQPDFTWAKARTIAHHHRLQDSVRGASAGFLSSNTTSAEDTSFGRILSFLSDGIEVGYTSDGIAGINESGQTYVAWNWLAGGTAVTNTDGTITSSVSANVDSGFSIVSWTGTGAVATVGHGLNQAPELVIVKDRDRVVSWVVGAEPLTFAGGLSLDLTDAYTANSAWFNSTSPTSSVVSVGTGLATNYSGHNMLMYAFHSVEGFSKIGSYTGNGSADGPFVHCGFKPAFVMIKRTDVAKDWLIHDSKRPEYNASLYLEANNSAAETSKQYVDLTSNGFKIRTTALAWNASGGTYIFYAVAEAPAKYSTAR